jgi:hypothetical protein
VCSHTTTRQRIVDPRLLTRSLGLAAAPCRSGARVPSPTGGSRTRAAASDGADESEQGQGPRGGSAPEPCRKARQAVRRAVPHIVQLPKSTEQPCAHSKAGLGRTFGVRSSDGCQHHGSARYVDRYGLKG